MEPTGQLRDRPAIRSVLRGQTLGQDRTPDRSDPCLGLASSDLVISCQNGQCQSLGVVGEGHPAVPLASDQ